MISGIKTLQDSVKTFFFGLHLICPREKNRGRASSPPMLLIGKNLGKIANYPPNAKHKSAPMGLSTVVAQADESLSYKTQKA